MKNPVLSLLLIQSLFNNNFFKNFYKMLFVNYKRLFIVMLNIFSQFFKDDYQSYEVYCFSNSKVMYLHDLEVSMYLENCLN